MRTTNRITVKRLEKFLMIVFISIPGILSQGKDLFAGDNTPQTIEELNSRIEGIRTRHDLPGMAVALVSKDSIIWAAGFGHADLETHRPVTENTLFRVGSCTKSFIGLGFLKLAEEGKIDLNTPVKAIAAEIDIDNPWEDTDPVRIIHLLEHTAGFDDIHLHALVNHESDDMSLRQALEAKPLCRRVRWKPGTRYAYASPGYTLAGYILEKITGLPYEDFLNEHLLEPMGMESASFRLTDSIKAKLATGYGAGNEPLPFFDGYDRPAASLNASVKEMARFVRFLLNDGKLGENRILRPSSLEQIGMTKTSIAAGAGLKWGYGFGIGAHWKEGRRLYSHSGGAPGFIARYACIEEVGVGCVVLSNKFDIPGTDSLFDLAFQYLTRNMPPVRCQPAASVPDEVRNRTAGYYEFRSPRMQLTSFIDILFSGITVKIDNGDLYRCGFMEKPEVMIPVSSNMFRNADEPEASMVFTQTSDGKEVFATPFAYYEKAARWKPFIYRPAFIGAWLIMLSTFVYALIWIPAHLLKKGKHKENRSQYLRLRIVPLLAVLCLIIGILLVSVQSPLNLGQVTFNNILFFISTWLFLGFSLLSLPVTYRSFFKRLNTAERVYAVLLSLSCFGMAAYLARWGIIGLRIWAY